MSLARKTAAVACALAVAGGIAACGKEEHPGVDEPAREGLALELGGVDYNVFITRELNPEVPPDDAYYKGPPPAKGQTLYGVFIQVCNSSSDGPPRQAATEFEITDNQGNKFEPTELPEDNDFAYHAKKLAPKECIPPAGSVAQLGPTAGSMLLFELPLTDTENRPLELEIKGAYDAAEDKQETLKFELDI